MASCLQRQRDVVGVPARPRPIHQACSKRTMEMGVPCLIRAYRRGAAGAEPLVANAARRGLRV